MDQALASYLKKREMLRDKYEKGEGSRDGLMMAGQAINIAIKLAKKRIAEQTKVEDISKEEIIKLFK